MFSELKRFPLGMLRKHSLLQPIFFGRKRTNQQQTGKSPAPIIFLAEMAQANHVNKFRCGLDNFYLNARNANAFEYIYIYTLKSK